VGRLSGLRSVLSRGRREEAGHLQPCQKILIVKPSSLGDIVHSLPFLNAIQACFPKAEIHWVVARGLEGLLEGHPMIGRLIVINKDMWKRLSEAGKTVKEVRALLKDLRNERYDLVVDLQGLLRSGIITMATRAPIRIGFQEAREGSRLFYSRKVRGGREVHAVDRYLRVAGKLGCDTGEVLFPFPLVPEQPEAIEKLRETLGEYAVIVPGARWKTKIWPAERFGEVAAGMPIRSVVVGSRADIQIAEKVVGASGGKALSLAGRTDLQELVAVMRHARCVVSNDSGPMHIAAAFQVPVVAIFGPTSPVRTGPYGRQHIILKSDRDCAPCFKKSCAHPVCMESVTADMVSENVRRVLSQ